MDNIMSIEEMKNLVYGEEDIFSNECSEEEIMDTHFGLLAFSLETLDMVDVDRSEEGIVEGIKNFFKAIGDFIMKIINGIKNFFGRIFGHNKKKIDTIENNIKEKKHTEEELKKSVKNIKTKPINTYESVFSDFVKIQEYATKEADRIFESIIKERPPKIVDNETSELLKLAKEKLGGQEKINNTVNLTKCKSRLKELNSQLQNKTKQLNQARKELKGYESKLSGKDEKDPKAINALKSSISERIKIYTEEINVIKADMKACTEQIGILEKASKHLAKAKEIKDNEKFDTPITFEILDNKGKVVETKDAKTEKEFDKLMENENTRIKL